MNIELQQGEFLEPKPEKKWTKLEDFHWNPSTNKLRFEVNEYSLNSKIKRYVSNNYKKTPIYIDGSVKKKNLKTFSDTIDINCFANVFLERMDIPLEYKKEILDQLGFYPEWFKVKYKAEIAKRKIEELKHSYRDPKLEFRALRTDYPESDKLGFGIRLLLAPVSFGLSFIGYLTKKERMDNAKTNSANKQVNAQEYENLSREIAHYNKHVDDHIEFLENKLKKYEEAPLISFVKKDDEGYMDIAKASQSGFKDLAGKHGVYIIKNVNKNKFYVGQAKDLCKRLNQHFHNGKAYKRELIPDFLAGDKFVFKYVFVDTKDELDAKEKELIEYYDAFNNGYNKTAGNV